MINKIRKYIIDNNLIENNDTVIAGISGGADSICLLCVLRELAPEYNLNLIAVHVNHCLRDTALRDQEYTESMCRQLNVKIHSVSVNVKEYSKEQHLSTEEAARILRYQAFDQVAAEYKIENYKIAVAHNMNDNVETIILNMARGTGIKGMSGITPSRDNIIRPLMCLKRSEIEEYLQNRNLQFCTDETNLSLDYSRNKVRHNILPVITSINEGGLERINELSLQIREAEDFLELTTKDAMKKAVVIKDKELLIKNNEIEQLHPYIRSRVILESIGLIAGKKKDIGAVHVEILEGLFSHQVGKCVMLPYDVCAKRDYEGILLYRNGDVILDRFTSVKLNVSGTTAFGDGTVLISVISDYTKEDVNSIPDDSQEKWFDYDKILNACNKANDELVVRCKEDLDSICINKTGGRKLIKKLMVDEKISAKERDFIPLIAIGNDIIWVLGYRDSSSYRIDGETKQVLKIKIGRVQNEG